MTSKGHPQFPSALDGSVYPELWQTDEAFSLLILQYRVEGEGGEREPHSEMSDSEMGVNTRVCRNQKKIGVCFRVCVYV